LLFTPLWKPVDRQRSHTYNITQCRGQIYTEGKASMKTITVTGTGSASAAPDLITISMTVTARDMDYSGTMAQAAERLDALRASLVNAGFSKDDIKTTSFSVNTEYQHEHTPDGKYERRFAGYNCVHQLAVKFDLDMEHLSNAVDAISGCKGEPEYSIHFGLKDGEAFKAEMLQSAAKNARTSAEVLAAASGVVLGELVSVSYSRGADAPESSTNVVMMRAAGAAEKMSVDFAPEDISRTDHATFVWEIK